MSNFENLKRKQRMQKNRYITKKLARAAVKKPVHPNIETFNRI